MSNQMKFSCPNCDSENIAMEKRPGGWFHCLDCHYSWQPYPVRFGFDAPPRKQTVFEAITQSEETLAEKLVYCVPFVTVGGKGFDRWYSALEPFDKDIYYYTKERAVAVTVAKLKESYEAQPAAD